MSWNSGTIGDSVSVTVSEAGTLVLPFSDFEGADWSDVDGIRVTFTTFARAPQYVHSVSDFRAAVPEPSMIALIAVAAIGLACLRRPS